MKSDTDIHSLARRWGIVGIALAALVAPLGLTSPAFADIAHAPASIATQSQSTDSNAHDSHHESSHTKEHAHKKKPVTWTVLSGSESRDQAIQGMSFLPKNIYVDAGDTVKWVANAAEIHTVTFLASGQALQPFNPADPSQLLKVGGTVYDGTSYYNSGVMSNVTDSGFPASTSYRLTFPKKGNYTYYCLVHGVMMKGTVHVASANAPYRYTQEQYNRQAKSTAQAIFKDGYRLWATTKHEANRHTVMEGADDGVAMVMRFIQPTVTIHVGQTVTFVNNGMAAPHTVTFGTEPANPAVPLGDPSAYSGGQLNSGIQVPGDSFKVTFTAAGTYSYICALHDYMGMTGKVIVKN